MRHASQLLPTRDLRFGDPCDPRPTADALDSVPEWHTWFRWSTTPSSIRRSLRPATRHDLGIV